MDDHGADPVVDLASAADHLYGLDLADFTTARKRLAGSARACGDADLATRIDGLRVPTLAAWAVNQLVRVRPDQADALRRTGDLLRAAQSRLDAASLGALRPQRDALLIAFVSAAVSVALDRGQRLSSTVRAEVHNTLVAALADERAQEAVLSGQLVKALWYAGLGEVPVAGAPASVVAAPGSSGSSGSSGRTVAEPARRPSPRVRSGVSTRERSRREQREDGHRRQAAQAAARAVRDARDRLDAANRALADASLLEAEAQRLVGTAQRRVAEFEALLESARAEHAARVADAEEAGADRVAAAGALDAARRTLSALTSADVHDPDRADVHDPDRADVHDPNPVGAHDPNPAGGPPG